MVAGGAGVAVILYATRWGAAISDDTYFYIHAARDLLAGNGLTLTPHFPPGLSLALAAAGLAGLDPLQAVRWLNALLFGLNSLLVGAIILAMTGSTAFSIVGSLLFFSADALIETHAWAMSEPLFICLMLLGFFALAYQRGKGGAFLAGLFWGLAAATRYIGVAFLPVLAAFCLLRADLPIQQRLRRAVGSVALGLLPLGLYMLRNQFLSGQLGGRVLAWHPMSLGLWRVALGTVLIWFIPGRLVHGKEWLWLAGLLLAALAGAGAWFLRRRKTGLLSPGSDRAHLVFGLVGSILAYLGVLVVSRSFLDDAIPMDDRLLSPVLVLLLLTLVLLLARIWSGGSVWLAWRKGAVILVLLVMAGVNLTRSVDTVKSYHALGRGYASARDSISETYAYLRKKPGIPIYSNESVALYFWLGRETYSIPASAGVAAMQADMTQQGAYLVIFDSVPVELYRVTRAELVAGLVEQIHLSEATIYRAP